MNRRPRRAPFVALVIGVLVAGLCALLALNTATTATAVRQRSLDAHNSALNESEQQLARELAVLQAPQNLAARAGALGLVPDSSPAFLRVNPDGTATVLGHPGVVHAVKKMPTLVALAQAAAKQAAAQAKQAKVAAAAKAKAEAKAKAAAAKTRKAAKKAAAKQEAAKQAAAKKAAARKGAPHQRGAVPPKTGQKVGAAKPTPASKPKTVPNTEPSAKKPGHTTATKTPTPTPTPTPSTTPTKTKAGHR